MEPEHVVAVKRWPAVVLCVLLTIFMGLSAAQLTLIDWTDGNDPLSIVVFLVVITGSLTVVALLLWSFLRTVATIRHPPRLTAHGMRLWLIPTREYVFVPWQQCTALRVATRGVSTGLYVYVAHPDGLAGGNPANVRKIRRFAQRYLGAPFVYPVSGSTLDGLDYAVRGYSNGHQALRRG
ncbi:MAG: hypothetical protein GEV04_20430 [Actinophytocola sp.]|nr:hypothetical protein [Actinophytocola sp.]